MRLLYGLVIALISAFFAQTSAYAEHLTGIGMVAENMMDPVSLFSDFVYTGCIVIGSSFLFASIVKYFEHRRSPLMVPISTVVFLLLLGILLLLLPFLAYLNAHGVPYSLFKFR